MIGRKRKVRLHLQDFASSVDGVLVARRRGHYILWAPAIIGANDEEVKMAGHIEVPTSRVLFVQVL